MRATRAQPTSEIDRRRLLRIAALGPQDTALAAWQRWRQDEDPCRFDPGSQWWLPLVWWNLRGTACDAVDRRALRDEYMRAWIRNEHLLAHAAPVLRACHRAGIQTLLLKGAALALTTYERSGLRPFGDVDVLVTPQDASAARDIVARLGWAASRPIDPSGLAHLHGVAFTNQEGVDLDLHQYALAECCTPNADAGFWRRSVRAQVGDVETRVLCPSDQLLQVCVHGLRFAPIPTSHWMADAATIIRHTTDRLSWDAMMVEARGRRLTVQLHDALASLEPEYAQVPSIVMGALDSTKAAWWEGVERRAKPRGTRPWAVVQAWCAEARSRDVDTAGTIGFSARLQTIAGATSGRQLLARTALAAIGRRPRGRTHAFEAYGRRIDFELELERPESRTFLAALADRLPPFSPARGAGTPDRIYRVLPQMGGSDLSIGFRLLVNRGPLATATTLEASADHIVADLHIFLTMAVTDRTFIHAGVVSLNGRAIVLPGDSGSGKSTLVEALLRAGAVYGSDEFALLDDRGHVHAFPRPLRLRHAEGDAEYVRPAERGAATVAAALTAGVVLFSPYRPEAEFSPGLLSASAGLLRLLAHSPSARDRPSETMARLRTFVNAWPLWMGERGNTDDVVRALKTGLVRKQAASAADATRRL